MMMILHWSIPLLLMIDFEIMILHCGILLLLMMDFEIIILHSLDSLHRSIFHWSIVTLLDSLRWRISIFWRMIRFILYVGASNEWYGNYWTISCYHSFILGTNMSKGILFYCGIATLMVYLALRYDRLIGILINLGADDTLGSVFSTYLVWSWVPSTFRFIPNILPLILSHLCLSCQSLDCYLLLSYLFSPRRLTYFLG